MTTRAGVHILKFSRSRRLARLRLEREAETQATAAPAGKAGDPIMWDTGRLERRGGVWYFIEVDDTGIVPRGRPLAGSH